MMIQYTCKAQQPSSVGLRSHDLPLFSAGVPSGGKIFFECFQITDDSSDSSPCPMSTPPPDAPLHRRPPPWPLVPGAGAAAISWPWSVPVPGRSRVLP
jgi:hypothetical protein